MTATTLLIRAGHTPSVLADTPAVAARPAGVDLAGARDRDLAPEVEGAFDTFGRVNKSAQSGRLPEGAMSPSTPSRDFFAACHTVAPPARYIPAFGPHRGAHLSLAAVVAGAVYSVEGRV